MLIHVDHIDVGLDCFLTAKSINFHILKHFLFILKDTNGNITSYFWTFADCQELHFEHH